MRAKKNDKPAMDVMERFRLHVEASIERDKIAKLAIDLLEKGKRKEGTAAAAKAEAWAKKVKALER